MSISRVTLPNPSPWNSVPPAQIAAAVAAGACYARAETSPTEASLHTSYRAKCGDFHKVIAMYHGQGHRPVKGIGLQGVVKITIGLPVVRTSAHYGTAFDVAGNGKGDERSSLVEAMREAMAPDESDE